MAESALTPHRWVTVACPRCGAGPGEHCREPIVGFVHMARHDAAVAATAGEGLPAETRALRALLMKLRLRRRAADLEVARALDLAWQCGVKLARWQRELEAEAWAVGGGRTRGRGPRD